MPLDLLYIISGLILLPLGAEGLVRGSTVLALRLGVTALAVGLTIVAFGTGSPELALSVEAARAGNSGIALGNVVGSNISNIALVLGLAALVKPMSVRSELIRREMPLMIGVTVLLCGLLIDGQLSRLDGLILVIGAFTYTGLSFMWARRGDTKTVATEFDEALDGSRRPLWFHALLVIAGLVALVGGANFLLKGAVSIATKFGVSEVVIGLSVIAVGTSLPELATSVTSSLRNEPDVAFGNVIGSNIFNILAVLGAAALIRPFHVEGLRVVDVAVLIASSVLLLPLMWRGSVLNRWEGAALLTGYAIYLYSIFA